MCRGIRYLRAPKLLTVCDYVSSKIQVQNYKSHMIACLTVGVVWYFKRVIIRLAEFALSLVARYLS